MASLAFLASEPLPIDMFPDPPHVSGSNTLDLTDVDGVFRISGTDEDSGTQILLKFRERTITFEWEARVRNGAIDVITITLLNVRGKRGCS